MKCALRKMNVHIPLPQKFKRTLQAMTAVIAIIYMTLVLYQNVYGGYTNLEVCPLIFILIYSRYFSLTYKFLLFVSVCQIIFFSFIKKIVEQNMVFY